MIKYYLLRYKNGIGSEALHIIIKLGYGVHNNMDKEEILQSLAYLVTANLRIDVQ